MIEKAIAEAPRRPRIPRKEFWPEHPALVVDHKVIVEAKAIAKFSDADFAQSNNCLHFANFKVGLLINFHNWPLKDGGIKRLVNTRS